MDEMDEMEIVKLLGQGPCSEECVKSIYHALPKLQKIAQQASLSKKSVITKEVQVNFVTPKKAVVQVSNVKVMLLLGEHVVQVVNEYF